MSVDLSVLVPCFNEEGNLPELVERTLRVFERRHIAGEIVLVNDASRDRTGEIIDALAAKHPNVIGVHHPTNRGIAGGWQSAFEHSHGAWVCTIDADLQNQPEAIAQLWREIQFTKADLVQGRRSSLERYAYDVRYYMSRALDYLLKIAFGMREYDVKSGFVIYRRDVFASVLREAPHYYYLQHMITVLTKAKGYSLRQVETLFEERRAGQSFISLFPAKMIARTFIDIGRALLTLRIRQPTDTSLQLSLPATTTPTPASPYFRTYATLMRVHHVNTSHNAARYLQELRATQWLAPEDIERLQLRRLRSVLSHAIEHVGYWREALSTRGIDADDLHTLDDLRRVPVLTKAAVRENIYFDLLSDHHDTRTMRKVVTYGHTGELLTLFIDRLQDDMRWANAMRAAEWTGWRFGNAIARLEALPPSPDVVVRARARLDDVLTRRTRVDCSSLDQATIRRLGDRLRAERPALLETDGEIALLVACMMDDAAGAPLGGCPIAVTGQMLAPEARALVERRLGGRFFDRWFADELGVLGQTCEEGRLHVNAESFLVEVLRDGEPVADGDEGDVVVTDLSNRCVPLLRYALGDRAVMRRHRCACGRGLPVLERVIDRPPAVVAGASGRWVPATFFARLFEQYEYAVRRFQVVQDTATRVELRLVRRSRFTDETERAIRATLAPVLGGTLVAMTFVAQDAAEVAAMTPASLARLCPPGFGGDAPASPA